jgi:hypothetical protein
LANPDVSKGRAKSCFPPMPYVAVYRVREQGIEFFAFRSASATLSHVTSIENLPRRLRHWTATGDFDDGIGSCRP